MSAGLQVLHLWLEALASNEEVVRKWYHPWSFMSSPGWVQIKCELRLLAQVFSFLVIHTITKKKKLTLSLSLVVVPVLVQPEPGLGVDRGQARRPEAAPGGGQGHAS